MKKFFKTPFNLIKWTFFPLLMMVFIISCSHDKENWIIKAQDGKFYCLVEGPGSESYRLIEIDTAAINKLLK